eukprot:6789563-Heterocapsa_arctica.AAC.1
MKSRAASSSRGRRCERGQCGHAGDNVRWKWKPGTEMSLAAMRMPEAKARGWPTNLGEADPEALAAH